LLSRDLMFKGLSFSSSTVVCHESFSTRVGGVYARTPTPKLTRGSKECTTKNKIRSVLPDLILSMGIYGG
jgi:hypothetical protein